MEKKPVTIDEYCDKWSETTLPPKLKGIIKDKDYFASDPFLNSEDKGKLILIEGPDMMGKTTFCDYLNKYISRDFTKEQSYPINMRQPEKSSQLGISLYNHVITEGGHLDSYTEYLLFLTNRANHWHSKILPLLKEGNTILLDRSWPTTLVYNCIVNGIDWDYVFQSEMMACKKRRPDLMIILYSSGSTDPFNSLKNRGGEKNNRFDRYPEEKKILIRDGFLCLSYLFKFNFPIVTIDVSKSTGDPEKDMKEIYNKVIFNALCEVYRKP
jgi:thymidylate kinase